MKLKTSLAAAALLVLAASPLTAHAQSAGRNIELEEANRKLVVDFYDQIFNRHDVDGAAKVVDDSYKQHNPLVPDGKAPFVNFFRDRFSKSTASSARIVRSAAQGDLVWLHVHSKANDQDLGRAIVDIFRVKDGKVMEHWDVIQAVPEKAANSNTMF
jgi:predicted SnoaL-like aldol condensation-catalyzing enzyme